MPLFRRGSDRAGPCNPVGTTHRRRTSLCVVRVHQAGVSPNRWSTASRYSVADRTEPVPPSLPCNPGGTTRRRRTSLCVVRIHQASTKQGSYRIHGPPRAAIPARTGQSRSLPVSISNSEGRRTEGAQASVSSASEVISPHPPPPPLKPASERNWAPPTGTQNSYTRGSRGCRLPLPCRSPLVGLPRFRTHAAHCDEAASC